MSVAENKSVSVELAPYKGWNKNLRISNGQVELMVTLDVGPRIIRFGHVSGENVFGEFPEQLGCSGEAGWMMRGGHRLWIAPEHKPRTYEPDNSPVAFEGIANGIRTVEEPGLLTGIRKKMDISLDPEDSRVTVVHSLTNEGHETVECAAWALSVMSMRGTAIIPLPPVVSHDERVTPNQNWTLWSYTSLADSRYRILPECILCRQEPGRGPTKLGLAQRQGWIGYLVNGLLFIKRFEWVEGGRYPDSNVNFEVFTDERILELESLGPLTVLEPGASVNHVETWELYAGVDVKDNDSIFAAVAEFTQKPSADQSRSD